MKIFRLILFFTSMLISAAADAQTVDYQQVAADWLYAARASQPSDSLQKILADADEKTLKAALDNDDKRKTFWINIYNAATQTALKAAPDRYKSRGAFFKAKLINIAGKKLSLDEVEHGILRRSKNKLSLGYLNKLFPGRFEKSFRVAKLDYRIHFALNCGARSCPPVAFYSLDKINEQLQTAMTGHLKTETDYDSVKNTAAVTAFMGWFRADLAVRKASKNCFTRLGPYRQMLRLKLFSNTTTGTFTSITFGNDVLQSIQENSDPDRILMHLNALIIFARKPEAGKVKRGWPPLLEMTRHSKFTCTSSPIPVLSLLLPAAIPIFF